MTLTFKKILSITVVAVLLLSLFPVVAFAENKPYFIQELGLTLELPPNILAVTNSTPQENEAFNVLQTNKATTIENMKKSNQYLRAFPQNLSYELTLTATETEESKGIYNYKLLSKTQLETLRKNLLAQGKYSSVTISENKQAIFFNCTSNTKIDLPTEYIPEDKTTDTKSDTTATEAITEEATEAITEAITEANTEETYAVNADEYIAEESTEIAEESTEAVTDGVFYVEENNNESIARAYEENPEETYATELVTEEITNTANGEQQTESITEETGNKAQNTTDADKNKTSSAMSFTIVNGKQIVLGMSSKTSEITVEEMGVLSTLTKTIEFDKLLSPPIEVNIGKIMLVSSGILVLLIAAILVILYIKGKKNNIEDLNNLHDDTDFHQKAKPQIRKRLGKEDQQAVNNFFEELKNDGLLDDTGPVNIVEQTGFQEKNKTDEEGSQTDKTNNKADEFENKTSDTDNKDATIKQDNLPQQKENTTCTMDGIDEENAFDDMYDTVEKPKKKGKKVRLLFSNLKKDDEGFKPPQAFWDKEEEKRVELANLAKQNKINESHSEQIEVEQNKINESHSEQNKEEQIKEEQIKVEESKNTFKEPVNQQKENEFKKEKPKTHKSKAVSGKTQERKPTSTKATKEFETDSYWDKYK